MEAKLKVLKELNKRGFGYCTEQACEEDIMGVGITWEKILTISLEDLESLLEQKSFLSLGWRKIKTSQK